MTDLTDAEAAVLLTVHNGAIVIQTSENMDEDYVMEVLQATVLMLQQAKAQEEQRYRRAYRH